MLGNLVHPRATELADYVHGRLPPGRNEEVEQHLAGCEQCCDELADLDNSGIHRMLQSVEARGHTVAETGKEPSRCVTVPIQGLPLRTNEERYEIIREIGIGGMGVVFLARDQQLCRDVALKTLKPGQSDSTLQNRFVREAWITAQLDHPGVPATHELGLLADGRPFMAMRLVRGDTLKARLGETADRDRLLEIYSKLCDCIAFAHSRGIAHRDIKPSNVMVGQFGEVQVMDWGLAKQVERPDKIQLPPLSDTPSPLPKTPPQPVSTLATNEGSTADLDALPTNATRAGTILGTVAYMPPEQATGQLEAVGPASDVFSLGAVLCEILTGAPPYGDADQTAMLDKARTADLDVTFDRLKSSGADPTLVALALDCLAGSPKDRPNDATMIATRIDQWRTSTEQRLEDARVATARSETRVKEERKRRRVQLALIAATIAFAAVIWGLNRSIQAKRRDFEAREQSTRAMELAIARADLRLFDGSLTNAIGSQNLNEQHWEEATVHLEHAKQAGKKYEDEDLLKQLANAELELTEAHSQAKSDQMLLDGFDEMNHLGPPTGGNSGDHRPRASNGPRRHGREEIQSTALSIANRALDAMVRYGLDPQTSSPQEAADRLLGRPEEFRKQILGRLDVWFHFSIVGHSDRTDWIGELLAEFDPDAFRNDVRLNMSKRNRSYLAEVARMPETAQQPPEFVWSIGGMLRREGADLSRNLISLAQLNHMDNSVINRDLALQLSRRGEHAEASRVLMLRAATQKKPEHRAQALLQLAASLKQQGLHKHAVTVLRQAMELKPDIIPERRFAQSISSVDDPDFVIVELSRLINAGILKSGEIWVYLAKAKQARNDWTAAADAYEKGLELGNLRPSQIEEVWVGLMECEAAIREQR